MALYCGSNIGLTLQDEQHHHPHLSNGRLTVAVGVRKGELHTQMCAAANTGVNTAMDAGPLEAEALPCPASMEAWRCSWKLGEMHLIQISPVQAMQPLVHAGFPALVLRAQRPAMSQGHCDRLLPVLPEPSSPTVRPVSHHRNTRPLFFVGKQSDRPFGNS